MASRLRVTATISGTRDWLGDDATMSGETGLFAPSTVDFACAAASLAAAASSPLVSIRSCMVSGCSAGLGGAGWALLAGAFLAGAFFGGGFFGGRFFRGRFFRGRLFGRCFCGLLDCLGRGLLFRRSRCAVGLSVGL